MNHLVLYTIFEIFGLDIDFDQCYFNSTDNSSLKNSKKMLFLIHFFSSYPYFALFHYVSCCHDEN